MSSDNPILEAVKAGNAPKMVKLAAAKGALPLPADAMLELQAILAGDTDTQVQQAARGSLQGYQDADVIAVLEHKDVAPSLLHFCAGFYNSRVHVLEKIVTNPATENRTFVLVAPVLPRELIDLVITNQVRLIEAPEILYGLRQNGNLTPGNLQRLAEIEVEFLRGVPSSPAAPATAVAEAAYAMEAPPPSGLTEEEEERATVPSPEALEFIEETAQGDSDKATTLQKLASLPVSGKIKAALLGNREVRSLLIRDSNRLVSVSVLCSPKITDTEIELFSQLRNVSDDVLRRIGANREWTQNYKVAANLIRNPRAPLTIVLRLMPRMNLSDLKKLEKDKSIPDAVRQSAKRLSDQRQGE